MQEDNTKTSLKHWVEVYNWSRNKDSDFLYLAYLEKGGVLFKDLQGYKSEIENLKEGIRSGDKVLKPEDGAEYLSALSKKYSNSSRRFASRIKSGDIFLVHNDIS